jgi:hypothetical protein
MSTTVEQERQPVVSIDPATGEVWRQWTATSAEDIAAAVQRARAAQPAWRDRSLGERRRILATSASPSAEWPPYYNCSHSHIEICCSNCGHSDEGNELQARLDRSPFAAICG